MCTYSYVKSTFLRVFFALPFLAIMLNIQVRFIESLLLRQKRTKYLGRQFGISLTRGNFSRQLVTLCYALVNLTRLDCKVAEKEKVSGATLCFRK